MSKVWKASETDDSEATYKNKKDGSEILRDIGMNPDHKYEGDWIIALPVVLLHVFAYQGLKLILQGKVQNATILWMLFLTQLSTIGISVGAHRYYCHKSFKAKPLLEVIFIVLHTLSGEFTLYTWVKDHRLHHRYSDTDADPHNSRRGLIFSYMGWFMTKRNTYVTELEDKVFMEDLLANKLVMFQYRYIIPMHIVLSAGIPALISVYFFNETLWNSFLVAYCLRLAFHLNYACTVVVWSHRFGTRPYDKNIQPTDSWLLSFLSWGDGNHNFHHVYPWDYKNAENPNVMSRIIGFCEKLGLAYNLKEVSKEMIKDRVIKYGDGTHHTIGKEKSLVL